MKKVILILSILFFGHWLQGQVMRDEVSGKFYYETKSTNVEGTPYLYDDWRPSFITYADRLQVKNVQLKFDVFDNLPLFLRKDSIFEFVNEVYEFIIYNPAGDSSVFRNGFPKTDRITPKTYLQVLEDGLVKLLKSIVKNKSERKEFNSAVAIIEFSRPLETYYIYSGNSLIRLKKGEEGLKEIMHRHWDKVSGYMKAEKLNLKKETDLVKIFSYFNTL